jgi:predicted Zn-dependent peptidase
MLGGSASSRLFQEIREKRGMAYSVYTFASQYADTGLVGVYVGTREDNLAECMRITADQLVRMGDGEIGADELHRAKENLKGRIMLSMESTSNRASRLGKSVLTDTELLSLDRICAEIDAVEPDAVSALARRLFAPDRLSVAGIGPNEERFREAVAALNPALA